MLSSFFAYQAYGVLVVRQLYLEPPSDTTTTLTLVGQLRDGRRKDRVAPAGGDVPRPAATATATATATGRGARCVGSIVGTTLAEVLAHTAHRQVDGGAGRGERAHQIRSILQTLSPAKAALRVGGGAADRLALAMGAGSLKVVRTQRDGIDDAMPRQHASKRARRERVDAAYGSVAAALGCTAAVLATLAVLAGAAPSNALHFCRDGSVLTVLQATVAKLGEWIQTPYATSGPGDATALLDALQVEFRASSRAAEAVAAAPVWAGNEAVAGEHVRDLLRRAVCAAYPCERCADEDLAAPAAPGGGTPLRVIPLAELDDPSMLLFCSGAEADSSDDDAGACDGRSVRSARTSASASSVASNSSTASGLVEAFVDRLGVSAAV